MLASGGMVRLLPCESFRRLGHWVTLWKKLEILLRPWASEYVPLTLLCIAGHH